MRNRIAFLPDASEHTDPFLVLVEDWVGVEGGFPTHPHRGFETVTLVIEGSQEHRDSTGESGRVSGPKPSERARSQRNPS